MTLVCSPGSVAMPTVAELKGLRFCGSLRTFPRSTGTASVTAPAGASAGPDGHMLLPTNQPGGSCGGLSFYLHQRLHHRPRAQCLLPPSAYVCRSQL